MKRPIFVLVLAAVVAGIGGLIYMRMPATNAPETRGTAVSGIPSIETTVSLGIMSGEHAGEPAREGFETLRASAVALTDEQARELVDALSLTIIVPKQKLAANEKPVVRAFLRNDSQHADVFLRGSKYSAAGQFPVLTWKVTRTNGDAVPPAAFEDSAPVKSDQFGLLKPDDVLDLAIDGAAWPFAEAMNQPGTYVIQLEYSTVPAHPRNDAAFYEAFKTQYPDLS